MVKLFFALAFGLLALPLVSAVCVCNHQPDCQSFCFGSKAPVQSPVLVGGSSRSGSSVSDSSTYIVTLETFSNESVCVTGFARRTHYYFVGWQPMRVVTDYPNSTMRACIPFAKFNVSSSVAYFRYGKMLGVSFGGGIPNVSFV